MNLTITTDSGVKVTQPTEKWVIGILVAMADKEPELFAKVLQLVDNKVDAYAAVPESVQRSLTNNLRG